MYDVSFYQRLLDQLYDGVYFLDRERRITYWNRAAERLTGFSAAEVVGKRCADNILMHLDERGRSLCLGGCPAAKAMRDGELREEELYLHHKDGHRVPVLARVSPVRDDQEQIIGAVEIFSSNEAKLRERLITREYQKLALIDPLTEVGNRLYAEHNLTAKLNESRRYGWPLGVLFLDVDHFKHINDVYGHDVGDRALRMVARTLIHAVRSFDIVARWGGEEFLALFPNTGTDGLLSVADKLRLLVSQSSFTVGEEAVGVTISIGGTVAQTDDDLETLVKRADSLMYNAKQQGRNSIAIG